MIQNFHSLDITIETHIKDWGRKKTLSAESIDSLIEKNCNQYKILVFLALGVLFSLVLCQNYPK